MAFRNRIALTHHLGCALQYYYYYDLGSQPQPPPPPKVTLPVGCWPNPCSHGGGCREVALPRPHAVCACIHGYRGLQCETPRPPIQNPDPTGDWW